MNIHQVAERNNLGVASREEGDLRSALEHFSLALKFTMGDLEPAQSSRTANNKRSAPAQTFPEYCAAAVEQEQKKRALDSGSNAQAPTPAEAAHAKARASPCGAEPASAPFAYTRGINLIPCLGAYSPDPLVNTTVISSIIIFNLSIIYHLKGLEGSNQSVMRLSKAKTLYQKSYHLLSDAGVPMESTGNPVIDMLSMALFNNLAHVSYEMGCYSESRNFFDYLIRFALTVIPSRYVDAYVGSLLDQQKSNFLLNAIILRPPKLAAAA